MRRMERPLSVSILNADQLAESYGYDRPKLLWNICVVLIIAAIALFVIFISIKEMSSGSNLGPRYILLLASFGWVAVSVYLIGQYVSCMTAPFAVKIGVESIEMCTFTFSIVPNRRFISFRRKYAEKITFIDFGFVFNDPIEMVVNGEGVVSGGAYMLWRYVYKSDEVSQHIFSSFREGSFE